MLPYLTAEVTVVNLDQGPWSVGVLILDTESDENLHLGFYEVEALQVTSQGVVPARYLMHFYLGGGYAVDSCVIDIGAGDRVVFGLTQDGVAVAINDEEPDDLAELKVGRAPRCDAEEF